jgi:hypothetical protein
MVDRMPLGRRQVHLDFHTPGSIRNIGERFDPDAFASAIRDAHIDSVTVFSRCHHGFSYHPTSVGTMHPGLSFDLLGAQIDALHRVGVRAPIYVTVGWDELAATLHPEWVQRDAHGEVCRSRPAGENTSWQFLDLASPYADYVLDLTVEVLDRYAPVDGIFFDILRQSHSATPSPWLDRRSDAASIAASPAQPQLSMPAERQLVERRFLERASALVRERNPDCSVFFNSRLRPDRYPNLGSRVELPWYSHIEIESLPTGEWGYNHYPLFAAYFQSLGHPLVGMTGVFHTSWGDFGAIKPQAALDYECARMAATGAACSIGDHLHPSGELDRAVYRTIGQAYARMEAITEWCEGAQPVADVGIVLAETGERFSITGRDVDEGAMRMMLELHRPFQFIDLDADLSAFRTVVFPDCIEITDAYASRIERYLAEGGSVLFTHRSGLMPDGSAFAPEVEAMLGVRYVADAPHTPDYLVAEPDLGSELAEFEQVLHERGSLVEAVGAEVLASVGHPYFTRTPEHFFGHRQAPFSHATGYPSITQRGRAIYCHSPLFGAYRHHAVPAYREVVRLLLDRLNPEPVVQAPGLPTTAEAHLLRQPDHDNRYILHIVHAVPQRRGDQVDIVEDTLPIYNCRIGVRCDRPIAAVALAPSGEHLPHEEQEGVTWFTVPEVCGHQLVVLS